MRRLAALLAVLCLAACAPLVQTAGKPPLGFSGPRLEADAFVSSDGARLPMTVWMPEDGKPWAVIVGLHGMNDYANAYHLAGPWWAGRGIATYAFDQRGFGRTAQRGVWGGDERMAEDVRVLTGLLRARYPGAVIAVAGESMGGAVGIKAFASDRPPAADRLVLLAPAVWGWSSQPLPNKTLLWFAAHVAPGHVVEPPDFVVRSVHPTDNRAELIAMGQDRNMIWGARPDAIYGLVGLMETAWRSTGQLKVPTLYLYGANDEVIPKNAAFTAVAKLPKTARTAYYAEGWHLLLRDLQAQVVWSDVEAFLRNPSAPLPSGAPAVPRSLRNVPKTHNSKVAAVSSGR